MQKSRKRVIIVLATYQIIQARAKGLIPLILKRQARRIKINFWRKINLKIKIYLRIIKRKRNNISKTSVNTIINGK